MGIARPSFTRFCVALAGAFPTRESVLRPIAGSGLLSQTGDIAERIAISNRMNIFSDGVSRGEIIKPVWREKVRAVVCWGRGCTNGVTPERCGSRMAATPPTSRARLFPSQWHRRQSSSPLTATMHPTPQTTREPHLPASRKALCLQAWLSADALPRLSRPRDVAFLLWKNALRVGSYRPAETVLRCAVDFTREIGFGCSGGATTEAAAFGPASRYRNQ